MAVVLGGWHDVWVGPPAGVDGLAQRAERAERAERTIDACRAAYPNIVPAPKDFADTKVGWARGGAHWRAVWGSGAAAGQPGSWWGTSMSQPRPTLGQGGSSLTTKIPLLLQVATDFSAAKKAGVLTKSSKRGRDGSPAGLTQELEEELAAALAREEF